MFAARGRPSIPQREADGTEPAEERAPPHCQPEVADREARVVPRRLRATFRRGPQEGHAGNCYLLIILILRMHDQT